MTPQREQDLRVLEYVYDSDKGSGGPAGMSGLRALVGEDGAAVSAVELQRLGWVRRADRMTGGYHLTSSGRSEVEALRARRTDRPHRRAACRDALLRWVDAATTPDSGSRVAREDFRGSADLVAFTADETRASASFLAEQGLIKTISSSGHPHVLVWITDTGRECVDEGGVEPYLRARRTTGDSTVHNYNMGGSGNVFATATAAGAVANAHVNDFNLDHARLFARAVRAAQHDLGLDEDAEAALADVEAEDADPDRAQRATRTLTTFLMGTTTGTLGQVLGVLGATALGITG